MQMKPVKVRGAVTKSLVAQGSKSEHDAVMLTTKGGKSYILRRRGGPAFVDPEVERLVGSSIAVKGLAVNGTLLMQDWAELD
jgi:hypothetical protein